MESYIKETGFFILPSRFEPWAVAVHEFAAAGYPLLLSNAVGAASAFLEEEVNGFSFPPDNKEMLKEKLLCAASLNQADYNRFSEASTRFSQKITPEKWSNTLLQLIEEHKTKNHVRN